MKNRTLLILGFSVSLILMITGSMLSYKSIKGLLSSYELVEHTGHVKKNFSKLLSAMKDVETFQRGFLLTGQERFFETYDGTVDLIWTNYDESKELTADNPGQQEKLHVLSDLIKQKLSLVHTSVEQKERGINPGVAALDTGRVVMDSIRKEISLLNSAEDKLMEERSALYIRQANEIPWFLLASTTLAILTTVIFYQRVRNNFKVNEALSRQLTRKNQELTSKIAVIDEMAQQIAQGNYAARIHTDDFK